MKYGRIPNLDKDISKIVCGTDWLMGVPPGDSFKTLDAYVAAGGNCFDTAHCYGANSNILGAWLKTKHQAHKLVHHGMTAEEQEEWRSRLLNSDTYLKT